jgi:hypothetical protein
MQRQEYNLNQCIRQLDVREAHLRAHERRCDHRDSCSKNEEYGYAKREWIRVIICIVYFNKKHVRFSSDTTRLVIKYSILHAII